MKSSILQSDIEAFVLPSDVMERLRGSRIVVTGATGLIGSAFVRCLDALGIDIGFLLPVRNAQKARSIFGEQKKTVEIVETDIISFFASENISCDYILHLASPTDGRFMTDHPVETYLLAIDSTRVALEYARKKNVRGMVYASSIEYYGQIYDDDPVQETRMGHIDRCSARSSYALGKQGAEYLVWSYASEYGVRGMNARLTQVFGAGIPRDDKRVFAQFARSAISGNNIVLHTEGKSAKPYCYTTDCVAALAIILTKGIAGESYNVATPGTYLTIRRLAELFREEINPQIGVTVNELSDSGYAPDTTVNLDAGKLLGLGWEPRYEMREMLRRLAEYLKEEV